MALSLEEVKSVLDSNNKEMASTVLGEFLSAGNGFLNVEGLMSIRTIASNINTISQMLHGKRVLSGSLFYKDRMYTFAKTA